MYTYMCTRLRRVTRGMKGLTVHCTNSEGTASMTIYDIIMCVTL